MITILSIVAIGLSLGGSLLSSYCTGKKMDDTIEKKVAEALASKK